MERDGKIVSCRFETDDYNWLQRVKRHFQMGSIAAVTDSAILRDIVRRARESNIYGKLKK